LGRVARQAAVNPAATALAALQGAREARELLGDVRDRSAAPEALHVALQGLRAAGDGHRLRGFTRELQQALQDGQRRAPDLRDLKEFAGLRARAALHRVQLHRTDPADGLVAYFSVAHGVPRMHPDLASVLSRIEDLEARDETLGCAGKPGLRAAMEGSSA